MYTVPFQFRDFLFVQFWAVIGLRRQISRLSSNVNRVHPEQISQLSYKKEFMEGMPSPSLNLSFRRHTHAGSTGAKPADLKDGMEMGLMEVEMS